MTPAEADAELTRHHPDDDGQAALLASYRRQLAAFPGDGDGGPGFAGSALHRGGPPAHLTASALVLDETGRRTLLVLHRKAGAWLQPGGHLEAGDSSLAAAALREASEETGLGGALRLALDGRPADLHRHDLSAAFGRCREHLDVAFLLVAPAAAVPAASEESERVAWFDVDALPPDVVADLPPRLARARALLRASSWSGQPSKGRCVIPPAASTLTTAPSSKR